jgi:Zn-dependent peptidase ImmA (M78 family)/DNA-binding XRE family transcriptional regulator
MTSNNIIGFANAARGKTTGRRLIPARLRDARIAKRLNQSELATVIGVTRQAISAFEQGEKAPEARTMANIADILEQPLSFFTAENRPAFGSTSVRFFRAFGPATKRRNLMCDVLAKWFVQTARYFDDFVNFPPVDLLAASPASEDGRYTAEEIEASAQECRKMWGLGLGPISNVVALLESKGITTCRFEIAEEKIEAFSFWNGARPFIFLASTKESASRARFDAAHELGHLVLHRWIGPEELENPKSLKLIEKEANRFAGAFLLPMQSFPNEIYTTRLDAFVELKKRWKVAIQAMIYRCKDLRIFDEDQITNLYKQISAKKWRTREPLDDTNIFPLEEPRLLKRATRLVVDGGKKTPDEICADIKISGRVIEKICDLPSGFLASGTAVEFQPTLK